MLRNELKQFFDYLKKSWVIFGPKEVKPNKAEPAQVLIEEFDDFSDLVLDQRLPFFPFKKFFVPKCETLFKYEGAELKSPSSPPESTSGQALYQKGEEEEGFKKTALFGMNLLDMKAVLLYDQVFEKDPWYQARRSNILIIGHSLVPDSPQNIFEQTFEEDILEHLSFDIFLGALKSKQGEDAEMAVFTGSSLGQKILNEFGYKEYIHIQFSGPVKEGKLDERMLRLKDKLENHHHQKIWDELGERCIECGKCTVACPTCFCFRIDDQAELGPSPTKRGDQVVAYGKRERGWDSCFYQEFSEVAGGAKFLRNTAQRIHFWYYHKFARIPEEFDFMGCVGCRRCAAVCPVGIDIGEVLKDIENSK